MLTISCSSKLHSPQPGRKVYANMIMKLKHYIMPVCLIRCDVCFHGLWKHKHEKEWENRRSKKSKA